MNRKKIFHLYTLINSVGRYEAYCTSLTAYGRVAPPRNGTTIPRCHALPYTAMNAHYTSPNYRI